MWERMGLPSGAVYPPGGGRAALLSRAVCLLQVCGGPGGPGEPGPPLTRRTALHRLYSSGGSCCRGCCCRHGHSHGHGHRGRPPGEAEPGAEPVRSGEAPQLLLCGPCALVQKAGTCQAARNEALGTRTLCAGTDEDEAGKEWGAEGRGPGPGVGGARGEPACRGRAQGWRPQRWVRPGWFLSSLPRWGPDSLLTASSCSTAVPGGPVSPAA